MKDALDHLRVAMQELHELITDAVAREGGATKHDLHAFAQKALAATDSAKKTIVTQSRGVRKHLAQAIIHLEATQMSIDEAVKTSGQAFQTAMRKITADVRASVQKVSEAVAAARSTQEYE
jgi:hypothetical protein